MVYGGKDTSLSFVFDAQRIPNQDGVVEDILCRSNRGIASLPYAEFSGRSDGIL